MVPLITTMFISGLWHGAGYGFVIWGLINGVYLVMNHGWRVYAAHRWRDRAAYARVMKPVGFVVTFVAFTLSMIFFRATTVQLGDRSGQGRAWAQRLWAARRRGGRRDLWDGLKHAVMWVAILLFIALVCPNTLQILAPYEPALGVKPASTVPIIGKLRIPAWGPSLPWAIAVSVVAAVAIFSIGGPSEFLYWQF